MIGQSAKSSTHPSLFYNASKYSWECFFERKLVKPLVMPEQGSGSIAQLDTNVLGKFWKGGAKCFPGASSGAFHMQPASHLFLSEPSMLEMTLVHREACSKGHDSHLVVNQWFCL